MLVACQLWHHDLCVDLLLTCPWCREEECILIFIHHIGVVR